MNTVGNNVFSLNFLVWKFGDFFQKFSKNFPNKKKVGGQQSAKIHPPKNASLK
jgi:hypothetical protein